MPPWPSTPPHLSNCRTCCRTYAQVANLSNVAIPGTGIPMSWFFALGLFSYVPFLLVVYPLAALVGALYQVGQALAEGGMLTYTSV